MRRSTLWLSVLLCVVGGCAGADARDAGTTIDTTGDTIVARTPKRDAGDTTSLLRELTIGESDGAPEYAFSVISDLAMGREGQIFVWDQTEKALRLYDAQGKFVRQIGRTGSGPGEYDRINGITVRADGKLAIWDAGNGRINLYGPNGDYETTWTLRSGYFANRAITSDTANNVYIRTAVRRDSTRPFGTPGFIRFDADGVPRDSLLPPAIGPEPRSLTASKDGMSVSYGIPWLPTRQWAMSPHGHFVAGPGDPYMVYALPPDARPLKIERAYDPVPIEASERDEARETTLFGMRWSFPDYQWSGPDIPDHKPAYRSLLVDLDGRIWVDVSQPGEKIPEAEMPASAPSAHVGVGKGSTTERTAPRRTWREPTAYDVFAPNGEYLWHVKVPPRTTLFRMRGDRIWAVALDAQDLPTIVRYRVTHPGMAGKLR